MTTFTVNNEDFHIDDKSSLVTRALSFLQRERAPGKIVESTGLNKFGILCYSRIVSEFYPINTSTGAHNYATKLSGQCQGAIIKLTKR